MIRHLFDNHLAHQLHVVKTGLTGSRNAGMQANVISEHHLANTTQVSTTFTHYLAPGGYRRMVNCVHTLPNYVPSHIPMG